MVWRKVKLGDVCHIEKGNIGILKAIQGDYPLVVLGEERRTHNEYQFDGEAVVIPLVSSTGHGDRSMKRIHFQCGKFSVGSILCAAIPKDNSTLSAEFLYMYLDLNKEQELVSRMKGMANVSLSIKSIAEVEIPLPPIPIQQEIVKSFKNLQNQTNTLSSEFPHQLVLLKKLRTQILQDAIQGKLIPQNTFDEPASKLLERIRSEKDELIRNKKIKREKPLPVIQSDEILFEIPENWVWCRLGEICSQISDIDHNMPKSVNSGGVKFLSAKDLLDDGTINFERDIKYISEDDFIRLSRKIVPQKGDIIYSRIGAKLGKSRIVYVDERFIVSYSCCTIRTLNPSLEYLNFLLDSGFVLKQATINTTDHSIPDLGIQKIKEFIIPMPPFLEQQRIVSKIKQLLKHCDELEQSIQQNQKYSKELLHVALKEALEPKVVD